MLDPHWLFIHSKGFQAVTLFMLFILYELQFICSFHCLSFYRVKNKGWVLSSQILETIKCCSIVKIFSLRSRLKMHPVIDLTEESGHPFLGPTASYPHPPNPALTLYPNQIHHGEHHIIPIASEIRNHQSNILNSFQATNMVNSLIWSHYYPAAQDDSFSRYEHIAEMAALTQHRLQR